MPKEKFAVIGLDGATFQILRAYCDSGLMPNMKAVMDGGVTADLLSTMPPITGPAWTAFMTGKDPSTTGIYDWMSISDFRWDGTAAKRRMRFINSGLIGHKTLWEILSERGMKPIVINVPLTYPVRPVDGVIVSGFMTPDENCSYTHPDELKEEITRAVGDYRINISHGAYRKTKDGISAFFRDLTDMTAKRTELALHLLETRDWDFFMTVYIGMDRAQHWLWEYVSGEGGDVPGAAEMAREYYSFLDSCIGRLLEKIGPETPTFFVSDHGFTRNEGMFLMNRWLMREGFLDPGDGGGRLKAYSYLRGKFKRAVIGAMKSAGLLRFKNRLGRLMNTGELVINRALESPRSRAVLLMPFTLKVRRGPDPEDFERTRREVIDRMRALRDPKTGEPVFAMVERSDDVFDGPYTADMSDIIFHFRDSRYVATPDMPAGADGDVIVPPGEWDTGTHRMEGVFIARGRDVRKGTALPALRIEDVAPTMLYGMGLDVPEDMDGSIVSSVYEPRFVEGHEEVRSGDSAGSGSGDGLDEEEDEKVRESLESLGYL